MNILTWHVGHDLRYNDFHAVNYTLGKWSHNWQQFPGLSYIPGVTESENYVTADEWLTNSAQDWMNKNWHFSLYISLVYILSIPFIKQWVRSRGQPYNLRPLLMVWNSVLAVFSIIGVVRCLPEFAHILLTKGLTASFCQSDYYLDLRLNWWYLFFVWSKVIELVDTLFIILRGGKLIFLHWVHHCLTLSYAWFAFGDVPATARWMVNMNFMAHSLMYSYYALKAARIGVPSVISVGITSIQILQMVFGLYINYTVLGYKQSGVRCDCSPAVAITGLCLYTLFLILFVDFFVKSYLTKSKLDYNKNYKKIVNRNGNNNTTCMFVGYQDK